MSNTTVAAYFYQSLDVESDFTVKVTLGADTVITEEIVPSELGGYWSITVRGEGLGTISIYYNGSLYRAYTVDFSEQTTTLVTDNSEFFGG